MVHVDIHDPGPLPSFSGLGAEQRLRTVMARITADADPTGGWVEPLRPVLRKLIDYDAAWLGRFDAAADRYLPLLEDGDVGPLRQLFASDVAAAEIRQLGFTRAGWPLLGHRIMALLTPLQGWSQYLAPAGFRDGVGVGLQSGSGRHVGYLTLLTYRAEVVPATAAALLHAVNPLLGDAVERSRPVEEAGEA